MRVASKFCGRTTRKLEWALLLFALCSPTRSRHLPRWDTGTRNSRGLNSGEPNHAKKLRSFVELLKTTHADGINGDTMKFVPKDWWDDSVKIGWPLALEPEGGGTYNALNWETISVCHCNYKPGLQTVDHYKWLDARFQTSVRDRWAHDHTDALQFCVFNGVGFETTGSCLSCLPRCCRYRCRCCR